MSCLTRRVVNKAALRIVNPRFHERVLKQEKSGCHPGLSRRLKICVKGWIDAAQFTPLTLRFASNIVGYKSRLIDLD